MNPSYSELFEELEANGEVVMSRHGPTLERLGVAVTFEAGEMVTRAGIRDALGFMELMQIVAGVFDPEAIKRVAPRANHELFTAQMAYGPRIVGQVPAILEKLEADPDTRQAVLFIGSPEDGPTNQQPCTTTMQFLLRSIEGGEPQLNVVSSMRSWDVTRGLAYDVMFQGGLTMALARCLDVPAGVIRCTAGSLHLYEDEAHKRPQDVDRRFRFMDRVPRDWFGLQEWAMDEVGRMDQVPNGVVVETYDRGWS